MTTPQKASTSAAVKNKQDSKNNRDYGTKKSGSIYVPRQQATTKNTIPLSPMDKKSVVTSSLPLKPNSSRATVTSATATKNEQTMTITHTNSDHALQMMKTNEQLATVLDSDSESKKIGCTTNLPPTIAGKNIVPHNQVVNSDSSSERRATEDVGNLIEKMGQTVISTNAEKNNEELASGNKNNDSTTNWLPQMDGIEIDLPSSATDKKCSSATNTDQEMKMEEEMAKTEAYIQNVLYGKGGRRRRLPVFEEICPSDLFPEYCRD